MNNKYLKRSGNWILGNGYNFAPFQKDLIGLQLLNAFYLLDAFDVENFKVSKMRVPITEIDINSIHKLFWFIYRTREILSLSFSLSRSLFFSFFLFDDQRQARDFPISRSFGRVLCDACKKGLLTSVQRRVSRVVHLRKCSRGCVWRSSSVSSPNSRRGVRGSQVGTTAHS